MKLKYVRPKHLILQCVNGSPKTFNDVLGYLGQSYLRGETRHTNGDQLRDMIWDLVEDGRLKVDRDGLISIR